MGPVRQGDVLNGYRVINEPSTAGAGMSEWAVAERGGVEYFLKRFLAPRYPAPGAPGSPAGKARRRAECDRFEQRHLTILRRLADEGPGSGNLVRTLAFFRVDASYYKVTELFDDEGRVAPAALPPAATAIVIRTLLVSLRCLHERGVVHGDLKPENVLLQRTRGGAVTSKVIDFDDAFVTGAPPEPERLIGDPRFYAPEAFRYIKQIDGVGADALSTPVDVFAAGLIVHELVTGAAPWFDREAFTYPCEAIVAGRSLVVDPRLDGTALGAALRDCLADDPAARPSVSELLEALPADVLRATTDLVADRPPPAPPPRQPTSDPTTDPTTDPPTDPPTEPTTDGAASIASGPSGSVRPSSGGTSDPDPPGRLRSTMGRSRTPPPPPPTMPADRTSEEH